MRRLAVLATIGSAAFCAASGVADLQPIQVPVSTEWFGYDGNWSPVNVRVGSPQQWVSLFPNTLGQETWVIGASGCDDTVACISKRGGIFKSNESSTWSSTGAYTLNFQPDLGVAGSADYGLDTISIGDAYSVPAQIVGILNSTEFLLGSLGLGVIPTNFTSNNQATFLSNMVENQSAIPSHSYGYTAGAYYRLKGVPASLTLGGMDLNRFVPNDVSFDMASGYQPVVSIISITVSSEPLSTSTNTPNWTQEPLTLLDDSKAELFTIDSSTPFLWLPERVCDAFALALNLTYNENLQLYLYGNGTDPNALADWNMSFTFTIANLPGSSTTVDIRLPYDAFNHQLTFPFPTLNATFSSPAVSYFPLRKASNNTQYTIGRVFLQEAYLTVDYERNNFSVSQAKFENDAVTNVNLAAITRPANSIFAGPTDSAAGSLSTGTKIGIGIGAAVLIIGAIGLTTFFYFRRRKRTGKGIPRFPKGKNGFFKRKSSSYIKTPNAEMTELTGDKRYAQEVPADETAMRFELPGNAPVEMPVPVPSSFYDRDKARYGTGLAELEHQTSTSKNSALPQNDRSSHPSTLPPYPAAQVGRGPVSNISPSSTLLNSGGPGSAALSSSGISGITQNEPTPNSLPRHSSYGLEAGSSSAHAVGPPEHSPFMPPASLDRSAGQSSLSLPRPQGDGQAVPSRSMSRNSRFREEGISGEFQQPRPSERKFSWEDQR